MPRQAKSTICYKLSFQLKDPIHFDMQAEIIDLLPLEDIIKVSRVSRQWKNYVNSAKPWMRKQRKHILQLEITFGVYPTEHEEFEMERKRGKQANSLTLKLAQIDTTGLWGYTESTHGFEINSLSLVKLEIMQLTAESLVDNEAALAMLGNIGQYALAVRINDHRAAVTAICAYTAVKSILSRVNSWRFEYFKFSEALNATFTGDAQLIVQMLTNIFLQRQLYTATNVEAMRINFYWCVLTFVGEQNQKMIVHC